MHSGASPSVAELVESRGEPLPNGLVRLFVALKLASLAQGMSGVRWSVIEGIADFCRTTCCRSIAAENADDRIALARLFGALTGTGEVLHNGTVRPAHEGAERGRSHPAEARSARAASAALRHTAFHCRGARRAVRGGARVPVGVVAAALSAAGPLGRSPSTRAFTACIGSAVKSKWPLHSASFSATGRPRLVVAAIGPRGLIRSFRLGACLDLLRYAGAMLERAANGCLGGSPGSLAERGDRRRRRRSGLRRAGGRSDRACALRPIGDLSEARIAGTARGARGRGRERECHRTRKRAPPSFVAENRERARPTASVPDGVWRLLPMAGTTALVVAIEILQATARDRRREEDVPAGLRRFCKVSARSPLPASENGAAAIASNSPRSERLSGPARSPPPQRLCCPRLCRRAGKAGRPG